MRNESEIIIITIYKKLYNNMMMMTCCNKISNKGNTHKIDLIKINQTTVLSQIYML